MPALQRASLNQREFFMSSIPHCPRLRSSKVTTRHYARKVGSILGATRGSVGSATAVLGGAETGAILGMAAGLVGSALGGLMRALMGA